MTFTKGNGRITNTTGNHDGPAASRTEGSRGIKPGMKPWLCIWLAMILAATSISACVPKAKSENAATTETTASTAAQNVETTASPDTQAAEAAAEETAASAEETAPEEFVPEAGSIFADLPSYDEGTFLEAKEMGDDAEMLVYDDPSDQEISAYGGKLEDAGFELYAENEIRDNRYSTWTDGETTVTLMYFPEYDLARIVAEPSKDLPPKEEENVYTAVCDPEMLMVSTNYDGSIQIGMCFIYRLSDGSFIIVDGGYNKENAADVLFAELQKAAPDPDNIVIAAWIISHSHTDHIGNFYRFSSKYAKQVTLEKFICNFPSETVYAVSQTDVGHLVKTRDSLRAYGDPEVIEAHPGQILYIRDATIEMLYTWEMYPPNRSLAFMNDTSLVFTIDLGGERIMQLGDCGPKASKVVTDLYGDYLKSDIMQVAHHGLEGASKEMNQLIDADVACWPTTKLSYPRKLSFGYNEVLKDVDYTYIADNLSVTIPLPFDPEGVTEHQVFGE